MREIHGESGRVFGSIRKRTHDPAYIEPGAPRYSPERVYLGGPAAIDPVADRAFGDRQIIGQLFLRNAFFRDPVREKLPFLFLFHSHRRRNIGYLDSAVYRQPIGTAKSVPHTLGKLLSLKDRDAGMATERRQSLTRPFVTKPERDAALLRDAWAKVDRQRADQKLPRLSRKTLAKIHDVSDGMISHYMRAREPLNVKWQLRFAEYLGLSPSAIWADFPHKNLAPGKLPPHAVELTFELLELGEKDFDAVRALIQSLIKKAPKPAAQP